MVTCPSHNVAPDSPKPGVRRIHSVTALLGWSQPGVVVVREGFLEEGAWQS